MPARLGERAIMRTREASFLRAVSVPSSGLPSMRETSREKKGWRRSKSARAIQASSVFGNR
jgi:hypothetical protein